MTQPDTYDEGKFVQAERGPLGNAYEWVRTTAVDIGQRLK